MDKWTAFARALVDGNTVGARMTLESAISAPPAKLPTVSLYFSDLAAVAFIHEKNVEH